jgi:hypothetical protein
MKTKMKRQGSTELPRFAVGALAIAGASAANGATVQISFNNSYISSTSGNNIDADFGDDGAAEIEGINGGFAVFVNRVGASARLGSAFAMMTSPGYYAVGALVGIGFVGNNGGGSPGANVTNRGLVAVSFTDAGIRSGAQTLGYLDMTASATALGEKRITVNRLIFDQDTGGTIAGLNVSDTAFTEYVASAVPEPSSLGLLALGAGGLLARRRRAMAA